jgi:hypothetical protein
MTTTPVAGSAPFWDDVLGQYAILTALRAHNDPERAGLAVQGWAGDRLLAYESGPTGSRGHAAWQTVWGEPDWAEAFFRAMFECLRQRYQPSISEPGAGEVSFVAGGRHVTLLKNRSGSGVLLVDAASAEASSALLGVHAGRP